jgi:His-Xaa-Ser system protein HxsD
MTRDVVGMDADFLVADGGVLYATVDLGVYGIDALMKVAHRFTNRCYIHLQTEATGRIGVRFRAKRQGTDCAAIAGEFMNEVLDQSLRMHVANETESVRNLLLAHALSETVLLHPELETENPTEDPHDFGKPDRAQPKV